MCKGISYSDWSPTDDVYLGDDGYTNYTIESLPEGKAACKEALQKELGLHVGSNIPIMGFIGR